MTTSPKIENIETFLVDRPHKLSMTVMSGQTLMIVRIRCSDGIFGIGEGTTIGGLNYGAESPESRRQTAITAAQLHSMFSIRTSQPLAPTNNGASISRMFRPPKAGTIWRSSCTFSRAASSAGR
jgi:L-alanine-DL-glutamate epimerase-like enolase superfamily enzyme